MENNYQENPFPQELLTAEQMVVYREWKELFNLTNNEPPGGIEIGAIIMPTGDWLDRVGPALKLFREIADRQKIPPYLVISGAYSHLDMKNGGASAQKVTRVMRIFGGIPDEFKQRLIAENTSTNTKLQAENIYSLMEQGKIREPLVVVVSSYHLPRLVSTFVKTFFEREGISPKTRLYTIPVDLPWKEVVPREPRGERWRQVFAEMERIPKYREKGDVATKEELVEYTNWLRSSKNP